VAIAITSDFPIFTNNVKDFKPLPDVATYNWNRAGWKDRRIMIISDQINQYIDEAEAAFDQSDVETAISFYRKVQALSPGDAKYVSRLGALLYRQSEFQAAKVLYEEAIHGMNARNEVGVTLGNFHLGLGEVYLELGQLKEAESHFAEAEKLNAYQAMLHLNLANLYFEKGQYDKALLECEELLKLDPEDLDGLLGKARVYRQTKEFHLSKSVLDDAQVIAPENHNVEIEFGNLASALKDHEEALNHYRNASQISPTNPAAKYSMGIVYLELDEYPKAKELFTDVLRVQPNDADALYGLALAERKLGNNQVAIRHLEAAITAQPFNISFHQVLFLSQLDARRWVTAFRTALKARKILRR